MQRWLLYWHTLRYLRPVQVLGRLWYRVYRSRVEAEFVLGLREQKRQFVQPAHREPSLLSPTRFRFLNVDADLNECGWDGEPLSKLWRYNQHYFDDLNAHDASGRYEWHTALLTRWVAENPPGLGSGWEPYPTSLRIVNWIKWALAGNPLLENCQASLTTQAGWLRKHLEFHILGNHLFANAKALVFAGCFFQGDHAQRWLGKGLSLIERELSEQVLADGGHFERSPMYHLLAFEDVLDLINLLYAYEGMGGPLAEKAGQVKGFLISVVPAMWDWLETMRHPDDGIAFFNDAAFGIAPAIEELRRYAGALGFSEPAADGTSVHHLEDSGYIRAINGPAWLLFDAAPVGPDYLPGHAHADTLSFELSLAGQRLFVNSGTSEYGLGDERLRQRGTAAHTTVEINGEDSSEVWSGFRVARRARPMSVNVEEKQAEIHLNGCHDGYERLSPPVTVCRDMSLTETALVVHDRLHGKFRTAVARFYCHPDVAVSLHDDFSIKMHLPSGHTAWFRCDGAAAVHVVEATWHPRFGEVRANQCIEVQMADNELETRIEWGHI